MRIKTLFWFGLLPLCFAATFWFNWQARAHELSSTRSAMMNTDQVIGEPFTISTDSIDETYSAVAYNAESREFLVVWNNLRAGTNDIYAQRISEHGQILSWFYVADGDNPRVAFNPKNNTYLIVYTKWVSTDFDVYARRVDFTGPLGPEFPIAFNLNDTEYQPDVAYNTHPHHDEFLVVWETITPPPTVINRVEGQLVAGTAGGGDAGGETIGGRLPIAVNSDYNLQPATAYNLNMNEFLVVFTRQPGAGGNYDLYGRRVTGNGTLLVETPIDLSINDQTEPAVAAYHLNQTTPYLVVVSDTWNDPTGDVRGYLLYQDAQPASLINIATTPGQEEYNPSISQSETWGGYLVTWTQSPASDLDIYGRRVSNAGVTEPEFLISAYEPVPLGCNRTLSDNVIGDTIALSVWSDSCGGYGGWDIVGRLLGYRTYLPMTLKNAN